MYKIIRKISHERNSGFTIVELLIVIGIIGILATITYLTYSGWRESTVATQMKSDLSNAASAMENEKNFGSGYPATLPLNLTTSDGISLNLAVAKTSEYCIEALSSTFSDLHYYITQDMAKTGAEIGSCPTSYSSIASGQYSTCAIGSDKLVYCWGYNNYGQLGDGTTNSSTTPVAVDTSGVLSGKTIKAISVGGSYACVIASDDQAYCWGYGSSGRLGNNSSSNSLVPVAVSTSGVLSGKTIKSISTGDATTCAIASDDQVYCWGYGSNGQLGNNSTSQSLVPVAVNTSGVLSGKTIKSLSNGSASSCVIASDDQVYCWGSNSNGQLGNNSTTQSLVPVAVDISGVLLNKTISTIDVGTYHACAIASDNQAYCWGHNGNGELGNNSTTQSLVPVAVYTSGVLSGKTITSLSLNYLFSCAVASDGNVYCWGYNANGQLGNSSITTSSVPVAVNNSGAISGLTIRSISAGYNFTCAIASNNQSYCWGGNEYYQLGLSNYHYNIPVAIDTSGVLSGKTMKSLSSGVYHTCGIASDNQAYCWGYNSYNGILGNNSTSDSSSPVAVNTSGVLSGKTVSSISSGDSFNCVVASDNNAYCWGNDNYGQLGNNSTTQSRVPVAVNTSGVLSGKTIKSISVGGSFACVIASDNLVYCWGYNNNGQLGNNSTTQSLVPVAVDTTGVLSGKTVLAITTGGSSACAIASDNQAYCWGYDGNGALGNNSTTNSLVPVAVYTSGVLSGKTIKSITGSYNYACVIASDDQAYCWGYNGNGRLGNNSSTNSLVPVAVYTSGSFSGKTIISLESGNQGQNTCAIASDNQLYCWGWNSYGQLGNNSFDQSLVPISIYKSGILSGKTVKNVAIGSYHTCAIASDNLAYCWGYNNYGQLGYPGYYSYPMSVSPLP